MVIFWMIAMKVIRTVRELQAEAEKHRQAGRMIGFVPTMGCLHEGHLSLIRIARSRADVVVVSIFVNPTQFGPEEDLDKYPRDFRSDEKLAEEAGADIIFYPSEKEMYPYDFLTFVSVEEITDVLCGASRPGHFRGVATVCVKLFHAVKPHFAVFGQKDAQQVVVIRRMVKDLNIDVEIVTGPIVREADGLALSSRNTYLSKEERKDALSLNQSLKLAEEMVRNSERRVDVIVHAMKELIDGGKRTCIDYISVVYPETLRELDEIEDKALVALAVFVGKTRLIDNTIIDIRTKE